MKNHFIYIIGIIILIITVWLTTMAGLNANRQKEEGEKAYICSISFLTERPFNTENLIKIAKKS